MEKCPYCGSATIQKNISVGKTAETGDIGLQYKTSFLVGVEPLYVDLCGDCGSVIRWYVKNTARKWYCK